VINSFKDSGDILCIREVQNSIEDSVYKVIKEWIDVLGLTDRFTILKNVIVNNETGARFIFRGMQGTTKSSAIKSLKGVKYIWYEEAQTATKDSIDMLLPTIRINDAKFFFTMNIDTDDDVVLKLIVPLARCYTVHINYYENPHCPQILHDRAEECKMLNPDDYKHIWLGEAKSDKSRRTVLSRELMLACVDSHLHIGNDSGFTYAGLDLAAGEGSQNDKNALTITKGPVVLSSDDWRSGDMRLVADRTHYECQTANVVRLYYDAVGVGGFAGSELKAKNPKYAVESFMGQQSPYGVDTAFIREKGSRVSNKDVFANLKSQMWWNVRLRAENTFRLLNGMKVSRPEYYLSLSSQIPNVEGLITELSQATWDRDASGRIVIDKTPGDYMVMVAGKRVRMRSPNRPDSLIASFLRSCRRGLRQGA
jgi:phage terminase large subunit